VHGLDTYYETHGSGRPLVLLHGALSASGTAFGALLPRFTDRRMVVAPELQGHGHTADIDRPLSMEQMAEDVIALLARLGIEKTDLFGYSMGGGVALQVTLRRPDLVRRLVIASVAYQSEGFFPGLLENMERMKPEDMVGSPWEEEYLRIAPNPENWAILVEKVKRVDQEFKGWTTEAIQSLQPPTLIIVGDSDIVRPEHAVEMFRLLGGGVIGDLAGLPRSRLAILPATTHARLMERAPWIQEMVTEFLDADIPGDIG